MTSARWRERALCRAVEPETFFPTAEPGTEPYAAQVAVAKAVCQACPVRAECLNEALARIPDGIAGGLTPEERRVHRATPPVPASAPALLRRTRQSAHDHAREATGLVLLAAGRPRNEVAARCGVTERTVARWAARHRHAAEQVEGRPVAAGVPLRISHTNPLAGTRTEGHRG